MSRRRLDHACASSGAGVGGGLRARSSPVGLGTAEGHSDPRPGGRRDRGSRARPGGMIDVPWCIACGPSRSRSSPPRRSRRSRRPRSPAPRRPARRRACNGARSVLVISLPGDRVDRSPRRRHCRTSTRLLRHSAVADLATRTVRNRTLPGAGYMAFGAGGRSVARPATRRRTSSATSATRAPTPARCSGRAPASTSDPASAPSAGRSSRVQNDATSVRHRDRRDGDRAGRRRRRPVRDRQRRRDVGDSARCCTARPRSTLMDQHRAGARHGDRTAPPRRRRRRTARSSTSTRSTARSRPTSATRRQVVLVEASDLARADDYRAAGHARAAPRAAHGRPRSAPTSSSAGCSRHVDLRRDAVDGGRRRTTRARARTLTVVAIHAPHARHRTAGVGDVTAAPASSRSWTSRPPSSTSSTSSRPTSWRAARRRLHAADRRVPRTRRQPRPRRPRRAVPRRHHRPGDRDPRGGRRSRSRWRPGCGSASPAAPP